MLAIQASLRPFELSRTRSGETATVLDDGARQALSRPKRSYQSSWCTKSHDAVSTQGHARLSV
jgi:hypothetical protein